VTASPELLGQGPGHFQVEGMRPFLFTAETQEKANIIADLICIHYEQSPS